MTTVRYFLGVDTGGTFTDFYCWGPAGARIHKVLSTPDSPERAIVQGIAELGLDDALGRGEIALVHGSTVATNAALEGKGVRTAFVTNAGFADMLTLGRQQRADIYALQPLALAPPVPEHLCFEVNTRRGAAGEVVAPLTDASVVELVERLTEAKPAAVAINLLYAYLTGEDERRIARALPEAWFVSCSHEVLPEYKEYERGMATWLNAWLGPTVASYLARLKKAVAPCKLAVMQSHGGTMDAGLAARKAVNLLLSGPAGGLAAALYVGRQLGATRLMTFDMGGTSTDVALLDGEIRLTSEGKLGGYPVAVPMVDMHTIGAGGGSLAYLDAGGLLHVGPESAGAMPGPACYGKGGTAPSVTDANAALGRLRPNYFLGGRMPLNVAAAEAALSPLAAGLHAGVVEAAQGVITLVNEHMAAALRVISVQQGFDPAKFELCCFGGAGGLHVCALADALQMRRILIPAHGGVLSALGMLVAPRTRQLSQSLLQRADELLERDIDAIAARLQQQGEQELAMEGPSAAMACNVSVDCRYLGQSYHINLPWCGFAQLQHSFALAHRRQYGHDLPLPLELVNVRVQITLPALAAPTEQWLTRASARPLEWVDLPGLGLTSVWLRDELAAGQVIAGPAIICEAVATTLVAPPWRAQLNELGCLRLERA